MADWIIAQFPNHTVYTETFGGGGSVLLRKPRSGVEIYNDLGGEIVNLFRVARDQNAALKEKLLLTPFAREEFDNSYGVTDDPVERARRTIVRSFMGFGSTAILGATSGFRSNSRGDAIPSNAWRNYVEAFSWFADRLRGVVIENLPAVEVMKKHDSAVTLHYVDPPYVFNTRGPKYQSSKEPKHVYPHEMTDEEHREMAEFLHSLKGHVIVSGYRSDLYDEIFSSWHRIDRDFYADGARQRTESLWTNFKHERLI